MASEITGYIIANRGWNDATKLEMGSRTFASTPARAWTYHLGADKAASLDRPTYIQRWSERGWGPHEVTLSLSTTGER